MSDRIELDSDNNGIPDWLESGAIKTISLSSLRVSGGRLVGEVRTNGLLDVLESPVDTGGMAYQLANTDINEDDIPDFLDLESDNDGWPDLREAGVWPGYDSDGDVRIDAPRGTVGYDGIANFLQRVDEQSCCDLGGDGADDVTPVNNDSTDYQDLGSGNDNVELGGRDTDNGGHVDNFLDIAGGPDGTDDGLLAFPYTSRDIDGKADYDHVEFVPASNPVPVPDEGRTEEDPAGIQSQPGTDPDTQPVEDEFPAVEPDGLVRTGFSASGCS